MTITPSKPSSLAQQPGHDARRLRGDPARVERRVERVREHHQRHAGADRRRGTGASSARACRDRGRRVVGVHAARARGPGSASRWRPAAPPHMPSTAAPVRAATPPRRRRRRASPSPAGRRDVGHRREVHVHAGAAQLAARPRARRGAPRPASPCSGWPAAGPAQPTVRTSPPSWSTITSAPPPALRWSARVRRRHCARRAAR